MKSRVAFHEGLVDRHKIFAVAAFRGFLSDTKKLIEGDVPRAQGDFFGAGNSQPLTLFQYLHKMAGFNQRRMSACVKPGKSATEYFYKQVAPFHVGAIDVSNFQFASGRGFD